MLNVGSYLEFKTLSPSWNAAPAWEVWGENYRVPRPLSDYIGVGGRRLEGRGMVLILQKYSASYKMSGSRLLSNNVLVLSSTHSYQTPTICWAPSWYCNQAVIQVEKEFAFMKLPWQEIDCEPSNE